MRIDTVDVFEAHHRAIRHLDAVILRLEAAIFKNKNNNNTILIPFTFSRGETLFFDFLDL